MQIQFTVKGLLAFLILVNTQSLKSQDFVLGDMDVSFGIGFGTPYLSAGDFINLPPISTSFDMGYREDIGPGILGIGGYLGYAVYSSELYFINPRTLETNTYGYRYFNTIIAPRATYHYQWLDGLDTYAGLLLGFRYSHDVTYGNYPGNYPEPRDGIKIAAGIFVGAKYYFNPRFAAMTELGYGISYLTFGMSFRIQNP